MNQPTAQELINECPRTNFGRMVVRIKPKPPTAQEIIDLPDYWSNIDIVQWYNYRLKLLRQGGTKLK